MYYGPPHPGGWRIARRISTLNPMSSVLGSNPPNLVAIDLGAESCRVSLLRWNAGTPAIQLIHRCTNGPVTDGTSLHWDLERLVSELYLGLRRCGEESSAPIAAIGIDGWAVDYVRLDSAGIALGPPYCYRDSRTEVAYKHVSKRCSPEQLYRLSGVQPLRINTLYQLVADNLAGIPAHLRWVNLPEYMLFRLGGDIVAEHTNAAHTGLVDLHLNAWNEEIFEACGLHKAAAPRLVAPGTEVGCLHGADAAGLTHARLIAPACHDTASAIAGIPMEGEDWAYISSGTWSLPGTLLHRPLSSPQAGASGFTNLRGVAGQLCFHKNVNGMWLLKQVLSQLLPSTRSQDVEHLIATASELPPPSALLDLADPRLLLPGEMASRINRQMEQQGQKTIPEHPDALPRFANLIFHSLAAHYAHVLAEVASLTGKHLKRLSIVGGGAQNQFLNRLTAESTGLELHCGAAESSTIGNFAVQLATLEGMQERRDRIVHWAGVLASPHER
jgi:rhamnulokinase